MTEKIEQALDGVASVLNAELGLLKDIINRVADELNLPTENGNRVHDVLFWLDSPKPIDCTNATILKNKPRKGLFLLPTFYHIITLIKQTLYFLQFVLNIFFLTCIRHISCNTTHFSS